MRWPIRRALAAVGIDDDVVDPLRPMTPALGAQPLDYLTFPRRLAAARDWASMMTLSMPAQASTCYGRVGAGSIAGAVRANGDGRNMQFEFLLEQIVNGLVLGGYYLLIALGLSCTSVLIGLLPLAPIAFLTIGRMP